MISGSQAPRRRFQVSLRTLLVLFIPIALLTALATWLFRPPPIDVVITVDRLCWYEGVGGNGLSGLGLGAEVRVVNRSKHRVWYLENPRYYLLQCVDGCWAGSSSGSKPAGPAEETEKDWWSPQDGMQSSTILVGPISEKATAMKVGVPLTTDRIAPRPHWVFTPEMHIVMEGNERRIKVGEGKALGVRGTEF